MKVQKIVVCAVFIFVFSGQFAKGQMGDGSREYGPMTGPGMMHEQGMMGFGMSPMGRMVCGAVYGFDWQTVLNELDMDEQQKNRIQERIRKTARSNMEYSNELELAIYDLNQELRQQNPDQDKIEDLINKVSELRKNIMLNRAQELSGIRGILNKEQWNQLRNMDEQNIRPMNGMNYRRR